MLSSKIIQNSIDDLKNITRADFCVTDQNGRELVTTFEYLELSADIIAGFAASPADSQNISGYHLLKIIDEDDTAYVLVVHGNGDDSYVLGRIAVSEIKHLMAAYKERIDYNGFYQSLLMDNLLTVDIYNKAKKLNIRTELDRIIYLVEIDQGLATQGKELLKNLFSENPDDFVTEIDEKNLILIKSLPAEKDRERLEEFGSQIVSMVNTELMIKARVAYGTVVGELKELSKSYKEATVAMEVAGIFYDGCEIAAYSSLGIGRLIHQLPISLCEMYLNEIFSEKDVLKLSDEELGTINMFFNNNLNVSETARELFVHRNTLVYRLEKLQKQTGLDIRRFDDALTFKIALMVARYMKFLNQKEIM